MCVLTRPVLTYIIEHPDSWKEDFKNKHIKVKYVEDLAIFNYEPGADFNDIIVRDARGIIIDMKNLRIVCYPFEKFGNSYESYVKDIDWETALVQEKIDGCFTRKDTVLLADGTARSIAEIVNNKEQIEVLSYNFETKKIEPKKVVGWNKSADLESPEHFLTIYTKKIKNTLKGKISHHHIITPTKNHVFFIKKEDKIIEVCADELQVGDVLLTPTKGLTEIEKQVVLGGWLGDGSILNKNSSTQGFCTIHSQKQKEYVDFKASLFSSIKVKRKDYTVKNSYGKEKSCMNTSCSQSFTNLYNLCYKDGKKRVSKEWLEQLDWLGFAIWYMDDGSLNTSNKNNSIHLHTEGFSSEENQIIAEFFNQKGFKTYIQTYRGYNRINFSSQASEQIWKEIRKYIIPSMQHKLPERHQGFFDDSIYNLAKEQSSQIELTTGIIEKIEDGLHRAEIPGETFKYDIEVEDNHNYFCNGILVHNSITKLFHYRGDWFWATNSCINAASASITGSSKSFYDVIISADNYQDIDYSILDKNCTYIFELVSPLTQVVVYYPRTHLYHIGTRSNLSGLEFNKDIGIEKPKLYKLNSYDLESVISAAEAMDKGGVVEHEGFVVVDSNYNRMKVKNPEYLRLHHNISIKVLTKKNALETLISNDEERIHAIEQNDYLAVQLDFYRWQLKELMWRINNYMSSARTIYKNLNNDRRLFAEAIRGEELQSFGFAAIDNPNLDAIGALHKYPLRCFLKFIDDYPENK